MLTSAVPIYFGTDEDRFVTMQGGRAFTLPRVEIARRVKKKSKGQRQSRRPVHRPLVPDEAPFPGILRPQLKPDLTSCSRNTHGVVSSLWV